jgi:hypothetical protein
MRGRRKLMRGRRRDAGWRREIEKGERKDG